MTNPSKQQLSISVSTESLSFQYLVPEAGVYLGSISGSRIFLRAPMRLTGVAEDYCVVPPKFYLRTKGPHVVVLFNADGEYTVEPPPSLRTVLPYESFADRVAPGFYLGSITGASITFQVPNGRRSTTPIHTTLPGGDYVKGVDVPILIQVADPVVDTSNQSTALPTSSPDLVNLMRIAEDLGKIYKSFTHFGPRALCQKMLASRLNQFMMVEEAKVNGLQYRVICDDSVNPPDYKGLTKAHVYIRFSSDTMYHPVILCPGVEFNGSQVPVESENDTL